GCSPSTFRHGTHRRVDELEEGCAERVDRGFGFAGIGWAQPRARRDPAARRSLHEAVPRPRGPRAWAQAQNLLRLWRPGRSTVLRAQLKEAPVEGGRRDIGLALAPRGRRPLAHHRLELRERPIEAGDALRILDDPADEIVALDLVRYGDRQAGLDRAGA